MDAVDAVAAVDAAVVAAAAAAAVVAAEHRLLLLASYRSLFSYTNSGTDCRLGVLGIQ